MLPPGAPTPFWTKALETQKIKYEVNLQKENDKWDYSYE
jgi:hypothetical protein